MKKELALLLCFLAAGSAGCMAAESGAASQPASVTAERAPGEGVTDTQESMLLCAHASASYQAALAAQADALAGVDTAANRKRANENFADAIRAVSKATALDKENKTAWLLGSKIYRAKGGASYARKYFGEAYWLYLSQLSERPGDVGTALALAVVCRAGDTRYWSDTDEVFEQKKADYFLEGEIYAAGALRKLSESKAPTAKEDFQKLAAYILLRDTEQADAAAAKLAESSGGSFAKAAEEYRSMVSQGKWLWPVASRESAECEFLLWHISLLTAE